MQSEDCNEKITECSYCIAWDNDWIMCKLSSEHDIYNQRKNKKIEYKYTKDDEFIAKLIPCKYHRTLNEYWEMVK